MSDSDTRCGVGTSSDDTKDPARCATLAAVVLTSLALWAGVIATIRWAWR